MSFSHSRIPVTRRAAFIALPFLVSLAGCSTPVEHTPESGPAVAVVTARAAEADWPAHFDAGGVLRARTTALIASRLIAPITAVHVRAGDRVRRGQPLVELDAAALGANVARADAALTAATESVTAATADVTGAEAALALATATAARIERLTNARAATAQELDEAVAARAGANARLAAAKARQQAAVAALDAQKAGRTAAVADAADRTLTAPFDGVVIERRADPGSMATPGVPLLVIESPSALQLDVRLDAARASLAAVGHAVPVSIDSDPDGTPMRTGTITEISTIDAGTHSFQLKLDVPSAPGWRSGLYGRAHFTGAPRKTLTVPASAVIRRGQLTFVFIAAPDGRARLRAVSLGDTRDAAVELLDGVTAGEAVLTSPPATLTDGARIILPGAGR